MVSATRASEPSPARSATVAAERACRCRLVRVDVGALSRAGSRWAVVSGQVYLWALAGLGRVRDQVPGGEQFPKHVDGFLSYCPCRERRVSRPGNWYLVKVCPVVEIGGRVDGAVVLEAEQRVRVDLEMDVG
jgi:hypothetical protein